jgi:hypothetical protein
MKPYTSRITQMTIAPEGEPIYSEMATDICIEDEAAGEYIVLKQATRNDGTIAINPEEWDVIRATIDQLFAEIKAHESKTKPI